MTFLLARLDAAIARVVTCVADKVFGAIDAALFQSWDLNDGADWLSDWEAEHEVHEPPPLEDDRVAMMLGLVPDKRTPDERLWDAVRTNGESLKYHYPNK